MDRKRGEFSYDRLCHGEGQSITHPGTVAMFNAAR